MNLYEMSRTQIPDHKDYIDWDFQMVEWPRDFVFVLDQIGSNPSEGLESVIDSNRVGAKGYSYGGDISLALSGVRIDPEYYLSNCKQLPMIESKYVDAEWYLENTCNLAEKWAEFTAFVGDEITDSQVVFSLPSRPRPAD